MKHSWLLFRYIAKHYLLWLGLVLLGLAGIVFLFETAELLRRSDGKEGATFAIALQMGLFKLPETINLALPFAVLFAGMLTFWRLTRSQELVVVRAAGVSVWQFVMPVIAMTAFFGVLNILLLNPLGATMIARYRELEATYLLRQPSLELTGAGLWLRQSYVDKDYWLHADKVTTNPLTLSPLLAIVYTDTLHYAGRIDADKATLKDGNWIFANANVSKPGALTEPAGNLTLPTDLTFDKIQDSMSAPSTVSFWQLPAFIQSLQAIGFPATRHQMQWYSLLAQPWFLCAMSLFAAAFALRLARLGGMMTQAGLGVATGAAAFYLNNLLVALGNAQTLPLLLSAWAAPLICLASAVAALLYLEDG